MDKVLFSSKSSEWETPQELFDQLNKEFHFTLDVCATKKNAKCANYFSPEINGLTRKWEGVIWCNPPYGKHIGDWIERALLSSKFGATCVCLIPARTDTAWWHDYCMKGEIRFVRGRIKFAGAENSAPFPSALVIFRKKESQ